MTAGFFDLKDATKEGTFPTSFIPSQRSGDEQDIAGTLLYMVSRAGSYLNGTIILIDGGRSGMVNSSY
jgi:NAD(P)-dependent dehydrogenase (short-subunit alcohol dehydrogenase family)